MTERITDEDIHGAWDKEQQRYEDGCKAEFVQHEQSTPTPTDELAAILRGARAMGVTGETDVTFQNAGAALRAAGWKSPAEVAELVRASAEESWDDCAIAITYGSDDPIENPHRKPTPAVSSVEREAAQ